MSDMNIAPKIGRQDGNTFENSMDKAAKPNKSGKTDHKEEQGNFVWNPQKQMFYF